MKKKPQARKPRHRAVPQKKKILAMAVSTDVNQTTEKEPESQRQTKWYQFFSDSDNIYINDLAARAKRSPTHGAILQSKAVYTQGQGFTYKVNDKPVKKEDLDNKTQDYLNEINGNRQSLHWLFGKVAYDYIYSGNAYIEVKAGKEFTSLFYVDASKVRISEETAYISAYWRDIEDQTDTKNPDYPITSLELWDGNLETTQENYIIHLKNDVPEYDYYGLPEHLQILKWADVEYKIVQFNLDKLKNGFFPSVAMDIVGEAPEGMSEQDYVEKIRDSFTDEGNNHKMLIQLVDSLDQSTNITEFTTNREGELLELQNLATQTIIAGHRWFASLAGIAQAGSLGSNQQIRNEYNIALKGVIIPQFQVPLLSLFNDLMVIAGINVELGVLNVAPVGIEDKIEPKEVLTDNEQRELLGYEPIEENENGSDNGNDDVSGSED